MKKQLFNLLLLCIFSHDILAGSVGFHQTEIDANLPRALNISVWYPTLQTSPLTLIADNIAFSGTQVVRDAAVKPGHFPVVLLSHGYRGNWRNLNWLATQLAQAGYLVAAVNHPGTTSQNHAQKVALQWWQRPADISRVLDALTQKPRWAEHINHDDITVIGHSLGAWTSLLLVGARLDRAQLTDQCQKNPGLRACDVALEMGLFVYFKVLPKA